MPENNGNHGDGTTAVKEMVAQKGQELKDQTATTVDSVKDRVLSAADDRKGQLVDQAQSVRETATKIADDLSQDGMERPADWIRQAADSFDRIISAVEARDTQELVKEATSAMRGQPLVFAGIMLGLGFTAARLMSASQAPAPVTFNNSEPDWPTLNNPAPYARSEDVPLGGSPYAGGA